MACSTGASKGSLRVRFWLSSCIILEITLRSQVEYPQTPGVHCVFIPLIISSPPDLT